MSEWFRRFWYLINRRRFEAELLRDMQAHLERLAGLLEQTLHGGESRFVPTQLQEGVCSRHVNVSVARTAREREVVRRNRVLMPPERVQGEPAAPPPIPQRQDQTPLPTTEPEQED